MSACCIRLSSISTWEQSSSSDKEWSVTVTTGTNEVALSIANLVEYWHKFQTFYYFQDLGFLIWASCVAHSNLWRAFCASWKSFSALYLSSSSSSGAGWWVHGASGVSLSGFSASLCPWFWVWWRPKCGMSSWLPSSPTGKTWPAAWPCCVLWWSSLPRSSLQLFLSASPALWTSCVSSSPWLPL